MMMKWIKSITLLAATAALTLLCSTGTAGGDNSRDRRGAIQSSNLRPQIDLFQAPDPFDSVFYAVTLRWFSSDPDGRVDHHRYAVDPPAAGDTTWVITTRNDLTRFFECPIPTQPLIRTGHVTNSGFHVFVIKAVDDQGLESAPAVRAFTTFTIAPETQITSPVPSRLMDAITPTSFEVQWDGTDPDGVLTQEPTKYKTRLASIAEIQLALELGDATPTSIDIQNFFADEVYTNFPGWDSLSADTPQEQLTGLTPASKYYFAVVSFDEASAFESRFLLDNNVLQFRVEDPVQIETTSWGRVKADRR